ADLGLIGIAFHERFARGNRVLLGCGYVRAKPDGGRGSDSERCMDHVMLSILNRRMEEPYAYAWTMTSDLQAAWESRYAPLASVRPRRGLFLCRATVARRPWAYACRASTSASAAAAFPVWLLTLPIASAAAPVSGSARPCSALPCAALPRSAGSV